MRARQSPIRDIIIRAQIMATKIKHELIGPSFLLEKDEF